MPNPMRLLAQIGNRYPEFWKAAEEYRRVNRCPGKDFPRHCYLPLFAGRQIAFGSVSTANFWQKAGMPLDYADRLADASRIAAMSAWRRTKGLYLFDETLYAELVADDEPVQLPKEHLSRLPEWCAYIELRDAPSRGVFVHLDYDPHLKKEKLCLLFDTTGNVDGLKPFHVPLDDFVPLGSEPESEGVELLKPKRDLSKESFKFATEAYCGQIGVRGVLSLVFYLCSANADIANSPNSSASRKTLMRTKKASSRRIIVPEAVRIRQVGVRVGPALRKARAESAVKNNDAGETGRIMRPHIRRSHWHNYWKGSKGRRTRILKWLSPILVNIDNPADLPTTIRPVK